MKELIKKYFSKLLIEEDKKTKRWTALIMLPVFVGLGGMLIGGIKLGLTLFCIVVSFELFASVA